jgi:hypothetical protein
MLVGWLVSQGPGRHKSRRRAAHMALPASPCAVCCAHTPSSGHPRVLCHQHAPEAQHRLDPGAPHAQLSAGRPAAGVCAALAAVQGRPASPPGRQPAWRPTSGSWPAVLADADAARAVDSGPAPLVCSSSSSRRHPWRQQHTGPAAAAAGGGGGGSRAAADCRA